MCAKTRLGLFTVVTLFILATGQQLKHAKIPLIGNEPFIVVWNAPTERCLLRYNINLDLRVFDIVANTNEALSGSNVTIFYHACLGYYPYISDKGDSINGGVPQNESLTKHLNKAKGDIDTYIPSKAFQGLAVIDWENWRPQWDRNWGAKMIYRNKSMDLVRKQFPHWSEDKIGQAAKKDFENAAKQFMNNTILLAQRMRPNGLWGYYLFPDCYNYDYKKEPHNYTGQCPDIESSRNDRLIWLWKASSALFPSIYLDYILKSSPNSLKFVHHRVNEAIRVASMARNDYAIPVFVYSRPFYSYTFDVLSEADLVNTIGESAALGAAGIVLWGSSEYASSPESCTTVKKYVNGLLGHYVTNVTSAAKLCSKILCKKNGRCVRRKKDSSAYLHLNPRNFEIHTRAFGEEGPQFSVSGKHEKESIIAMKKRFVCHCYQGWIGIFCEFSSRMADKLPNHFPHNGVPKNILYFSAFLYVNLLQLLLV